MVDRSVEYGEVVLLRRNNFALTKIRSCNMDGAQVSCCFIKTLCFRPSLPATYWQSTISKWVVCLDNVVADSRQAVQSGLRAWPNIFRRKVFRVKEEVQSRLEITQKLCMNLGHRRIHCEGFGERGCNFRVLILIASSATQKTHSVAIASRRREGWPHER